MNENVFHCSGAYYDLLYRDKDYEAEAAYVVRTLRAHGQDGKDLLEFGSGTGRHGRLLAKHGFRVVGVERSEAMVAVAGATDHHMSSFAGSFDCMLGDIRSIKMSRVFDSVVSLFHVVSYQTTNLDMTQTFLNAARHLRTGGLFLFDVWHGPAVLSQRPATTVKRVEDNTMKVIRIAEPELDTRNSVVTVRYTMLAETKENRQLTTFREEHCMRYVFPSEVELLADHTGFKIEGTEEFLTAQEPSERTWGVAYLLRKRID